MYDENAKQEILKKHFEEGRTLKSLSKEYGVGYHTITRWAKRYKEEMKTDAEKAKAFQTMQDNLKLKKENEELKKEVDFLKKRRHFLRKTKIKEISVY